MIKRSADDPGLQATRSSSPQPTKIGVKPFATGVVKSAVSALKLGPLQGIADIVQGFVDAHQLEGIVEKEYGTLQQRLQTLLEVLDKHSDGDITPGMASMIKEIRDFIDGELNSVAKGLSGKQIGRLRMAKDEEERLMTCCRRIQEYIERLSELDTSLSMWEMEERHSQDKMSSLIGRLPSSPSACYNSGAGVELKRRECTTGTRVEVLANLLDWASNDAGGLYWLNGMAGTGKTTIAYSVCQELDAKRNLAASFFCSRQLEECRDVKLIIPSIAYQLARFCRPFRSALATVLEEEPEAHTRPLSVQFKMLLREPLLATQALPGGLIVVIDALDECENRDSTRDFLELLLNKAADLPIRFIVSSRPEPQIRDEMSVERATSRLVLHELDKGEVQSDIEKYLREGLASMSPSDEQISALTERAGILFIYAATAVRFIGYDNFHRNPKSRMRTILDASQTKGSTKNKEIDQLYITVLEAALGDINLEPDEREDMQQVLFAVICAREPLTVESLSNLLGINDIERVRAALRPLWSVLHVVGTNEMVTTLHASFPDFMFDSARSGAYWCDSYAYHHKLAEYCFQYIAQTKPQFNICGLDSSYLSDDQVLNIQERVAESISSELMYACRYWADHVKAANCASSVLKPMREFLSRQLLLWIEVLNLTNHMKAGMECAKLMVEWCKASEEELELAELARDAKRFVDKFALNPVSQSTPHIYVSMLAFWPESATIAKLYAKYTRGPMTAKGTALDRRQPAHLSTWTSIKRIEALAVSPNGLHIGLSFGKRVLLVDSSSGKTVLGPLPGHPDKVESVAFSPDGYRILSGSFERRGRGATILGWDTRTGDVVLGPLQLKEQKRGIECLSFSPGCSRIATGSFDMTLCVWDAETGQLLHRLAYQDFVFAAVFSADGTQVVAAAGSTLHRWDSHTGQSTPFPQTHNDYIRTVACSPDLSCIITGGRYINDIHVWNSQSGGIIQSIRGHTDGISCVGYSHDGKYIASGSYDRSVRVWDAHAGNMVLGPLEGHTSVILSVTFSADDTRLMSTCRDGLLCTWDTQHRNITPSSRGISSDPITCVKFISEGTRFVSSSEEGTISTWDAHSGEVVRGPAKVHISRIRTVDFKNNHVVLGTRDGEICVCDTRSGEAVLGPLEAAVRSEPIQAIAYSPDGKLIATGSPSGIDVWDAQDGSRILGSLADLLGNILSVQFSPDGTRIVATSTGYRSNIAVWDVSDGKCIFGALGEHPSGVYSASYSPNGALIASGSEDYTIIVWDAYTGKKAIGPLTGHSAWVRSVNFSPDNTRLVSGSEDRTIRIWDVQTGETMFELLHGHERVMRSVEYSPDGTRILSCSDDMSVRIHDARSPEERAQSRPASEVGDWTMNKDGWVIDDQSRLLVWVPGDLRKALMWPSTLQVRVPPQDSLWLKFDKSRMGESWARSYSPNT